MLKSAIRIQGQLGFLEDFIFLGHRLGDHPTVRVTSVWERYYIDSVGRHAKLRPNDPTRIVMEVFSGRLCLHAPLLNGLDFLGELAIDICPPTPFEEKDVGLAQLLSTLVVYTQRNLSGIDRRTSPVSQALGRALTQVRKDVGLTQAELAERIGRRRIALSRWEAGAQPPSEGPLYAWCRALGLLSSDKGTIVRVANANPALLSLLKEDPNRLAGLSPAQLEEFIAERLDRMGFDVTLTGPTSLREGGIDLIALPKQRSVGTFLLAGQIKHHRAGQKTGREAVDRLLAWKDSVFRLGLLVTNTDFTRDAKWLAGREAHSSFLRLRNFGDLKRWIEENFWSEEDWREIPDEVELAPGIVVRIPKPVIGNYRDIWPHSEVDLKRAGDGLA